MTRIAVAAQQDLQARTCSTPDRSKSVASLGSNLTRAWPRQSQSCLGGAPAQHLGRSTAERAHNASKAAPVRLHALPGPRAQGAISLRERASLVPCMPGRGLLLNRGNCRVLARGVACRARPCPHEDQTYTRTLANSAGALARSAREIEYTGKLNSASRGEKSGRAGARGWKGRHGRSPTPLPYDSSCRGYTTRPARKHMQCA